MSSEYILYYNGYKFTFKKGSPSFGDTVSAFISRHAGCSCKECLSAEIIRNIQNECHMYLTDFYKQSGDEIIGKTYDEFKPIVKNTLIKYGIVYIYLPSLKQRLPSHRDF